MNPTGVKDVCTGDEDNEEFYQNCFQTGMDYCDTLGSDCTGVVIHRVSWSWQFKGYQICDASGKKTHSDWAGRFKGEACSGIILLFF